MPWTSSAGCLQLRLLAFAAAAEGLYMSFLDLFIRDFGIGDEAGRDLGNGHQATAERFIR